MRVSFIFPARMDRLSSILGWIHESLRKLGWSTAIIRKLELASEEALVNIICHGYKEGGGQISLEISSSENRV